MLTEKLELKTKKTEKTSWNTNKVFPVKDLISSLAKGVNIFEWLSGFSLIVLNIGLLFGRVFPFIYYIVLIVIILSAYLLKLKQETITNKTKE